MKNTGLLFILILVMSFSNGQKHTLELKLVTNNTYNNVLNAKSFIHQKIDDKDVSYELTTKGKLSFKVLEQTDSLYNLEVKYGSISFEIKGEQINFQSDSQDTSSVNPFSTLLAKLIGQPFNVFMYKTGAIKEVKGTESLFANAFKGINIPEDQKEQMLKQLSKNFGGEAVKNNIEIATNIFPERQVAVQDKWTKSTFLSQLVPGTIQTIFQLTGVSDKEYIINGKAEVKATDPGKYVTMNGMDYNYQLSGTFVSEIKVDKESGWIKELKTEQTIGGKVFIKENSQIPGGMIIPMDFKTIYIITD